MDTKAQITKWFIEAVEKHPKASSDLKRTLKHAIKNKSPRIMEFINKLYTQILDAKCVQIRKRQKPYSDHEFKWAITEFTNLFVMGMEGEAQRRIESDLARIARDKKAQETAEMDQTLAGNPQGIFEEMGLVADEKTLGPSRDQAI